MVVGERLRELFRRQLGQQRKQPFVRPVSVVEESFEILDSHAILARVAKVHHKATNAQRRFEQEVTEATEKGRIEVIEFLSVNSVTSCSNLFAFLRAFVSLW